MIKKALIFAAGKGTRLKPFTDNHPKALAVVNNVPLLERNIKFLQNYGINDFVINVHHFGEQIIDFLQEKENFGAKIEISDEKNELLETGGGLVFAKKYLENEENFPHYECGYSYRFKYYRICKIPSFTSKCSYFSRF